MVYSGLVSGCFMVRLGAFRLCVGRIQLSYDYLQLFSVGSGFIFVLF